MIVTIIILILLLILSITLNVLMVWYNRKAVKSLTLVSENLDDLIGLKEEYMEHLNSLYSLEMFYGDSTLEALMDHTKFMIEEVKSFDRMYSLLREEGLDDEPEDEDEED